ncbi:MAG: ATPase [Burkholderiales bacterium RIFCSPHIGHO2_01_FULL_64_960]|nr:MAG: ATPase [Burkholderiales bacterium RIFCSPHIGHO2_01_FULL_64_960]
MSKKLPDTTSATVHTLPTLPGQADRLLRELEWKVIRRLDGLLQGDYRTLMRGSGLDLADLREYQPHDDVRHIDWNVTARLNIPHVRVFTEDREMSAWFLLDLSPSINFGPQGNAKRDILTGFVAVLSRLLTRHGNRVGAMLYGAGNATARAVDAVLPPRNSRAHVLHLVHRLLTPPAPATGTSKPGGGATELHRLLQTGLANLRRRSTVFVVSDFISAPGWEKPLAQLAQRHDVVAVRLLDPLELELPDVGLITLRDAESGEQLQVDTHDAGFRRRFARLAAERETVLREGLTRAGADTLELCTDDDLVDALLRFMDLRQRRVRTSRAAPSRAADPAQHAA